ncbi:hypothetical protein [Paraburkholderia acidisoli]|uniref:DUF2946 domain-containing protein n=1 Tax=Paraburkholderia acidisoli TaxID=2571748 RepID=A0A7Z2GKB6_9BURK|nr:hypothetical protein [Paraburkholderia acidisoli]QGZ63361.1 hypothetical protein FAZ98_16310 [Paraburkholderia acidisoli]
MNAFRRFLLRGGMASRAWLLAAFAVLFARALLPGAVMLDPVSVAQGDFALVMCSGHGPMFAQDRGALAVRSHAMSGMAMPGMDMSPMAGMMHEDMDMPGMSMPGSHDHDSMNGDDGLCPFSAALVVACVGIALAIVLFTLTRVTQTWRDVSTRLPARPPLHFRPLSRAPPRFS